MLIVDDCCACIWEYKATFGRKGYNNHNYYYYSISVVQFFHRPFVWLAFCPLVSHGQGLSSSARDVKKTTDRIDLETVPTCQDKMHS